MDKKQEHAARIHSMNRQRRKTIWTSSVDTQDGHAAMLMQDVPESWIHSMCIQHGNATWLCRKDIQHGKRSMNISYAAWKYSMKRSMDMGSTDVECSVDSRTCSLDMEMKHGHGHAA